MGRNVTPCYSFPSGSRYVANSYHVGLFVWLRSEITQANKYYVCIAGNETKRTSFHPSAVVGTRNSVQAATISEASGAPIFVTRTCQSQTRIPQYSNVINVEASRMLRFRGLEDEQRNTSVAHKCRNTTLCTPCTPTHTRNQNAPTRTWSPAS